MADTSEREFLRKNLIDAAAALWKYDSFQELPVPAREKSPPEGLRSIAERALKMLEEIRADDAAKGRPWWSNTLARFVLDDLVYGLAQLQENEVAAAMMQDGDLRSALGEPHCWVVPGTDTATVSGFIDANCVQDGELSRPLWPIESIKAAVQVILSGEIDRGFVLVPCKITDAMTTAARNATINGTKMKMDDWVEAASERDLRDIGGVWPSSPFDRGSEVSEQVHEILLTTWWDAAISARPKNADAKSGPV